MKILKITKEKYSDEYSKLLETYNVFVEEMEPSLISAMTAMKIAKKIDKEGFEYVIVENTSDAMASLSAKKITKKRNHKTIYRARPNTRPGTGMTKEIAEGVDGWIFVSNEQRECFSPTLRNTTVIDYLPIVLKKINKEDKASIIISWIGNIDKPERLKRAIDQVDDANPEFILKICGTGNARDTMPVVRWARSIARSQNVIWAGENYDTLKELAQTDALIKTNEDHTPTEYLALYNNIPVIDPDKIVSYNKGDVLPEIKKPNQETNIQTLIYYILSL